MARRITSGGVSLAYDPAGRLHQVAGGTTTRFLYDGADLIAEYNGSGVLQKRYVHGPGLDEPLVEYAGSGTTNRSYLLADERGSVIGVVNTAGTVTVNKYNEYGVPAATNQGRFQYTGQMWLSEVGLYHYKARAYHPRLGRFLQPDPIGYAGGMNLYAYAGNDPVNFKDPSGLLTCPDGQVSIDGVSCQPTAYIEEITVTGIGCDALCRLERYLDWINAESIRQLIAALSDQATLVFVEIPPIIPTLSGVTPSPKGNITCYGPARVMTGNPNHVGIKGGMNRFINPGTAAMVPRQIPGGRGNNDPGGASGYLVRNSSLIHGRTKGGQKFSGVDDVIDDGNLRNRFNLTTYEVQNLEMARDPGYLLVELITGHEEGRTMVTITLPGRECPRPNP